MLFNEINFKQNIYRVNKTKIFCIILTKKENFNNKAKLIRETWVQQCDNYRFLSVLPKKLLNNKTGFNITLGIEMVVNGLKVLQPPDYHKENYYTLSNKVFSSFKYIF